MENRERNYIRDLYAQIREAERQMRDKPMPELTKEDFFLFHETGNRIIYENAYFGRRKYLTVYAILALWSRKLAGQGIVGGNMDEQMETAAEECCIKRLEEILISICGEQFWALPAHVDFERIDQPETRLTIDLFAAETAQALSEIVLRLYDRLSCEVVVCVAREIIERVLHPFVSSEVPYSWWETDRCNWSAVCAGSIGMTAMNLDVLNRKIISEKDGMIDSDVLSYRELYGRLPANWKGDCLKRVCNALWCYLDGMEADGACTEGLGYYNYGMSFYAAFAEEYAECCGEGAERLMYREKCDRIALFQQKCYFASRLGNGISISFSDGSKHESFLPGLTAYLKHCYPQVQTPNYVLARPFDEDACYRYLTNERNISWLLKYAGSGEEEDLGQGQTTMQEVGRHVAQQTVYLLPAAQWLICQDERGNGFAAKGGNNDENHNHNDIGHFLCVFNGEMLLTDLGAGEYTKDYFSDRRYEILCNRSSGHSVPIINDGEQCAGNTYCADGFSWDEEENTLTISFAGAYPEGSLQRLVRRIRMCDINIEGTESLTPIGRQKKLQIEVRDLFTANENTRSVAENLVTEYEPVMQEGVVWIKGMYGQCSITVENCSESGIKIVPCEHRDHAGRHQTVYRITWNVDVEKHSDVICKMWITFYDR